MEEADMSQATWENQGTSWVTQKRLTLTELGQTIPNLFSCLHMLQCAPGFETL